MRQGSLLKTFGSFLVVFFFSISIFAQETPVISRVSGFEMQDDTETVIVKHLPDWKNVQQRASLYRQ